MKVRLVSMYKGPCIPIPYEVLNELNLEIGDHLELDIPTTHKSLLIFKVEQRIGDEPV